MPAENKPEDPDHQEILEWVQKIHEASDHTYGSPRMKEVLNVLGFPVSRTKARKLMDEADVQVRVVSTKLQKVLSAHL